MVSGYVFVEMGGRRWARTPAKMETEDADSLTEAEFERSFASFLSLGCVSFSPLLVGL